MAQTPLSALKSKYPQYKDMSDDQFAVALHKRYYPDKPISELYAVLGVQSPAQRDAKATQARTSPFVGAAANAFTFGLGRQAGAAGAAAGTGLKNLVTRAQGQEPEYGMGDAYGAQLEAAHNQAVEHPIQSGLGGILGGLAAPGMEGLARFVGRGVGTGLLASTATVPTALRGAAAGGALGAFTGAMDAEPGKMLDGVIQGGLTGATTGGAVPVVARAAGAVGGTVARTARALGRAAGARGDPNRVAAQRLAEALQRENIGPDQIRTVMNDWLRNGNDAPSLLDVARRNGPVQRLMRGSAGSDLASADAGQYADTVAGNLQDRAIRLTRRLTPDQPAHADAYAQHLADTQGRVATEMYPDAYAQPVELSEGAQLALSGGPGRAAIQRASHAAEAQMRPEQMAELGALNAGAAPGVDGALSAGTLDRARIAMGERARTASMRGANDLSAGYGRRAGMIDEALDGVPGLQEARGVYRGYQAQRDALDLGRANPMNDPEGYAAQLAALEERAPEALRPGVREAAGVGMRTDLVNSIGAPTQGATGTLNRLSTGANADLALSSTFGPEATANYRGALSNETDRLRNARMIDSSQGSQTAGRLEDNGLVDRTPPLSRSQIISAAIDRIKSGVALTDNERQAIVKMGVQAGGAPQVDEQLARLMRRRGTVAALTAGLSGAGAISASQYP